MTGYTLVNRTVVNKWHETALSHRKQLEKQSRQLFNMELDGVCKMMFDGMFDPENIEHCRKFNEKMNNEQN